jgi:hypothetical protein
MTPGLDSAIAVLAGAIASAIGLWANYKWGPAAKERKAIRERDRVEGRYDRHHRDDTLDDGEQDS